VLACPRQPKFTAIFKKLQKSARTIILSEWVLVFFNIFNVQESFSLSMPHGDSQRSGVSSNAGLTLLLSERLPFLVVYIKLLYWNKFQLKICRLRLVANVPVEEVAN
jgi:hypothetical protein